jgi:hypothetical protein
MDNCEACCYSCHEYTTDECDNSCGTFYCENCDIEFHIVSDEYYKGHNYKCDIDDD